MPTKNLFLQATKEENQSNNISEQERKHIKFFEILVSRFTLELILSNTFVRY